MSLPMAIDISPVVRTILLGVAIIAAVAVWVLRDTTAGDDYDWDI